MESSTLREAWGILQNRDKNHTGELGWMEVESALAETGITLGNESVSIVRHYFSSETGIRYQELLRNLQTSAIGGSRSWRVSRPAYTYESRNLRESEGSTLGRRVDRTPPPVAKPTVSVVGQLQSDKVDYMVLGLARENFRRMDKDKNGLLTPELFEACFRSRDLSPASMQLVKLSSLDKSGRVDFNKFNQIIEKYKYAPVKQSGHRADLEDHAGLSKSMQSQASPNKRLLRNVEMLSEKLKTKYRSAATAFRAFKRGEGASLQMFSTEMANLGLDFSPEETQELFTHISQGYSTLPFSLFNSAFEATSPQPIVSSLPRLSLTPGRFPQIRKQHALPSDRSPAFAYGVHTKRGDDIEKIIHNDFASVSPRRKLKRKTTKRGPIRLRPELEAK